MPQDLRAKLYGYCRSTAAYRVRIALGLQSMNVSREFIHLRNGEQISTDYLATAGLVPHWVEGELNLAQSIAIIGVLMRGLPIRRFCQEIRFLARSFAKFPLRFAATFIQSAFCGY